MMFRSLRWRLVILLSLVILLTVTLTGILSVWATFYRFGDLVTEEGQARAEEMAPLFEANYAYWGGWRGLDDLLDFVATDAMNFFAPPWDDGVDWLRVVADQLALSPDALTEAMAGQTSLADFALERGVDPHTLVDAIVEAERQAMTEMAASGEVDAEKIDAYMQSVTEDAYGFVFNVESQSPGPDLSNGAPAIKKRRDVYLPSGQPAWTEDGIDWLLSVMFMEDDRLLVADADGVVLYDSFGELGGDELSGGLLELGAPMKDAAGDFIGTVVVTSGPGYYTAQQLDFLHNVSWSLAVSGLIAGLVALLAGLLVARRVTAPVTALTQAARRLADGSWPERLPVENEDELGQMSMAFNQMADALETQQALRSRLVDDITHELNTPLSVIQLELEALKDGLQTPGQTVVQVQREIDMLRALVEDLTLLSEVTGDEVALNREPADLAVLTSQAVERWRTRAESAGVTLHLITEPDLLPPVAVDARRLAQALGNLIANAIQHSDAGDRIEIRVMMASEPFPGAASQPFVHPDLRKSASSPAERAAEARYVVTTVTDSGPGIPAEDLPFVFERFYRTDRSRSRRAGGRGLGLAIVQEVIAQHGGHVWAMSQPGEGSVFGYSLPVE
jgi:signal transduction histidine kinase